MKAKIEVADRKEAELLRRGLADPATRALVKVMGALLPFETRAQHRILGFAADKLNEDTARG